MYSQYSLTTLLGLRHDTSSRPLHLVSSDPSTAALQPSLKSPDPDRNIYEPYVDRRAQLTRIQGRLFEDTTREHSTHDFSFATQHDKYLALVRQRNRLSAELYAAKSLRAYVDLQLNRMKEFPDSYTGPAYGDDASISPDSERDDANFD